MQARRKYRYKKEATKHYGPIKCEQTIDWTSSTADTFKCDEKHLTAAGCNFECIPYTCVMEQLMERAIDPLVPSH